MRHRRQLQDGVISAVGRREDLQAEVDAADIVVDASGATVAPGLIDSHCHVVLGDYTPRQKTVDFLASYVHGGITSVVSPGEIHAQGRPHDADRGQGPGHRRHVVLPQLPPQRHDRPRRRGRPRAHADGTADFADLQAAGVRLAKFGFGLYEDPADGYDQVRWAQAHGITVMCHSGGASIPGSKPITPEHLLHLAPDVCGHINGGPTLARAAGVDRIIEETDMALQLVQAGNLRSAVRIIEKCLAEDRFDRIVIGSDTPTGTGVMPLGVMKTVAELSSLTDRRPGGHLGRRDRQQRRDLGRSRWVHRRGRRRRPRRDRRAVGVDRGRRAGRSRTSATSPASPRSSPAARSAP